MLRLGHTRGLRTISHRLATLPKSTTARCAGPTALCSFDRAFATSAAGQHAEAVSVADEQAQQQTSSLQSRPSTGTATRRRSLAARKQELVLTRPASLEKPFFQSLLNYMADFPDALLLCKVGQFYESYFDQAIEIAGLLKITLTGKNMEGNRYPMCGIPVTQLDKYLEKLVREHNRFVAICEEHKHYDAEGTFRYMTRKVARVVTPGTLVDESFIEKQRHNYLLAIDLPDISSEAVELAWIDTSTGEFYTQGTTISSRTFQEDIARVMPSEVVLPEWLKLPEHRTHPVVQVVNDLEGSPRVSYPRKDEKEAIDDRSDPSSFSAIPLLSAYIRQTLLEQSPDLAHPLRVRATNGMRIDHVSLRALEIKQNNEGGRTGTLLSVLDRTVTSAGQRLLGDRLTAPAKSVSEINARLSLLAYFKENRYLRDQVIDRLHQLDDEVRVLQKMSIGRPTAEDLLAIARAIRVQGEIKTLMDHHLSESAHAESEDSEVARNTADGLTRPDALAEEIENSVDIGALEAQRARDYAAEEQLRVPSSTSDEALDAGVLAQNMEGTGAEQSEDMDDAWMEQEMQEDEGLDPWNIPLSAVSPRAKAAKAAKAETARKAARTAKAKAERQNAKQLAKEAPALQTKAFAKAITHPITWGKIEPTVMQPDSSPAMSLIYDEIDKVEVRAKRLYKALLSQTGAAGSELGLKVVPRHGPVLRVTLKRANTAALRDLEEKGSITMLTKLTTHKVYSYNPWIKLNSEMQGLLVRLKEAESYAVRELCNKVLRHWDTLRRNAAITAELDVATSLAKAAIDMGFTRPIVHEGKSLAIKNGRHPVAEHELKKRGQLFEANDTLLNDDCRLHVVTGPNMGGKSTVLRAVGIIAAMAQAGSFVPAEKASIGIVDQLFARIRYSDNIARGRSSFRVEMDDAAYILENATDRSLVLLDEFGRGTTADYAVCIAESTMFALCEEIKARSLFATHLHDIYDIIHEGEERKNMRQRMAFFCTQIAEQALNKDPSLQYAYRYKLEPGVNRNPEAFKVAAVAGYPDHLLKRAQLVYDGRVHQ